ncbi:MAG: hypothetical protein WCQ47_03210 [bacterium]
MKKLIITLVILSSSTFLLTACLAGMGKGANDISSLTMFTNTVADCDGIKTDLEIKSSEVDQLKTQANYCTMVRTGLADLMIWLNGLKASPEKVCPNLYDFDTQKLGELDNILIESMNSLITSLNVTDYINSEIFQAKFVCSPASLEGSKATFIRIFPKYLLAKKANMFCPELKEDTLRTAVAGALEQDIKINQLPGYTSSLSSCPTVVLATPATQPL